MQQALQDAKITPADIEKIILIGGPTRMPMVRQFVASVMNKEPERGIDPMEAVAMGAAIQGAIIAGDVSTDILLVDVTPLTLGVEVLGGLREPLIERNTTIPTKRAKASPTPPTFKPPVQIHGFRANGPMQTDVWRLARSTFPAFHPPQRAFPHL